VRALVTGATGFTGAALATHLAARGDRTRALARRTSDPETRRRLSAAGIELVEGDLRDAESLNRACDGIDVVYHIAALYRQAGLGAQEYRAVNADAVRGLFQAAQRGGVRRIVHCSTVGVHGDVERPPANEDAPLRPGDVYQETKLQGEQIAREAASHSGVEVVVARPTGIYGPGDRRLLKLFREVARQRFIMLGRGQVYYHLTYIDDLVEGFRLCGEVPQAAGRTYILAGPEVTTLDELVGLIAEEAGVRKRTWHLPVWPVWAAGALCEAICFPFRLSPPLYRRRVDFFTKSRAFDISRARAELGYDPCVGLREGIRRTLEWYRRAGWV
jgi:nucleoside-diphosphate-sugar epimerase